MTRHPLLFLILLSNQHVILDYLSNNAGKELAKLGYTVAVLEYPGYGVSVGKSSKKSWLQATYNAARFLNQVTEKKIYLVGHSIGGPLAFETASLKGSENYIAGAISYGGFSNVYEMTKDQVDNKILTMLGKPMAFFTVGKKNNIDGLQMKKLAQKSIKALVLHGAKDGAVKAHHLKSYQRDIKKAKKRYPNAILETKLFAQHYHEEVNNFSQFAQEGFYRVWDRISQFIEK